MKAKTKSPIKDKPPRYVAQSADEAIDDLINERILGYYSASVIREGLNEQRWGAPE